MMAGAEEAVRRVPGRDGGGPVHRPRGPIQPRGRGTRHWVSFLIRTVRNERMPHAPYIHRQYFNTSAWPKQLLGDPKTSDFCSRCSSFAGSGVREPLITHRRPVVTHVNGVPRETRAELRIDVAASLCHVRAKCSSVGPLRGGAEPQPGAGGGEGHAQITRIIMKVLTGPG